MHQVLSFRRFALGIALGAIAGAAVLAASTYAATASTRSAQKGALVALRKTTLGSVLVDARGHTLYLFKKDRQGMSACDAACAKFWPPLVSRTTPRAGQGVHKARLGATRRQDGRRQVTYAGHPLYTFVADKKPGQTAGEGLNNFGATWDAVASNGHSVEPKAPSSSGNGTGYGPGW
jgi:predicted lipoprotein with Yx(FWY)xxD motif